MLEGVVVVLRREVRIVVEQRVGEFAPTHFRQEMHAILFVDIARLHAGMDSAPDLQRANFSEAEMRGQAGCRPVQVRPVAIVLVAIDRPVEEFLQPGECAVLSGRPIVEAGRPVWLGWMQAPIVERLAVDVRSVQRLVTTIRVAGIDALACLFPIGVKTL